MSNFDEGRQADLAAIEDRLLDPTVPDRAKRKMRRTKTRLQEQAKMPDLNALRRRYLLAVKAGDEAEAGKIGEQLKKYDQRLGLDNSKL